MNPPNGNKIARVEASVEMARRLHCLQVMSDITLSSGMTHADFVRRACLRYVQNRDEANDLAQEVLLKITRRGWFFWGGSRPATWLYRVATNHCLDHLRREKRLRGQAEIYAAHWRSQESGYGQPRSDPEEEEEDPDPVRRNLGRQVLERLRATAGEADRQLIYLRFDLDLSQSGIAEILGVSRAAVNQRLRRIHARATHLWWLIA